MKSVRGGVPREEQWRGADEGDGIQLRDIWRAVLTTKEGICTLSRSLFIFYEGGGFFPNMLNVSML